MPVAPPSDKVASEFLNLPNTWQDKSMLYWLEHVAPSAIHLLYRELEKKAAAELESMADFTGEPQLRSLSLSTSKMTQQIAELIPGEYVDPAVQLHIQALVSMQKTFQRLQFGEQELYIEVLPRLKAIADGSPLEPGDDALFRNAREPIQALATYYRDHADAVMQPAPQSFQKFEGMLSQLIAGVIVSDHQERPAQLANIERPEPAGEGISLAFYIRPGETPLLGVRLSGLPESDFQRILDIVTADTAIISRRRNWREQCRHGMELEFASAEQAEKFIKGIATNPDNASFYRTLHNLKNAREGRDGILVYTNVMQQKFRHASERLAEACGASRS